MSNDLTYLVIHCLATPEGREVSGDEVRRWHTLPKPHGRGWSKPGYNDLIHLGGLVENLIPYNDDGVVDGWEIANGVRGINGHARHVAFPGGMTEDKRYKDTRTKEQRIALTNYVRMTIAQHPAIVVGGHYQFDEKKYCPGFDVVQWLRAIRVPEQNILVRP
jgi:N-acetylmuramoyl-L-alanine amidase